MSIYRNTALNGLPDLHPAPAAVLAHPPLPSLLGLYPLPGLLPAVPAGDHPLA